MASISLQHIYKIYPGDVTAVKDFNLEIADKEFIILVGPSGCGIFDTRYRAGDNDLSRTVVVGRYANFTFCIYCCTDFFYFFIRQCDNSSHGGRSSFASFLHSHCTCIHKLQSIFKTQCTGSNQCRELTK